MLLMMEERGVRDSCLGPVIQLKVYAENYNPLSWREIWDAFVERYPNRWAVQMFPPADQLIDSKNVYHLFVLTSEPDGLNLR